MYHKLATFFILGFTKQYLLCKEIQQSTAFILRIKSPIIYITRGHCCMLPSSSKPAFSKLGGMLPWVAQTSLRGGTNISLNHLKIVKY